jgi:hypothetical protein
MLTVRSSYLPIASVSFVTHHTMRYALSEPSVLLTKRTYRNLNLSAVSFSLPLPIRHVTRSVLKHSWQHFILGYRLCTVNVESIEPYIHDQKMSRLCVPTLLYSCITLYKYEGERSQCFPTQIMHGSGSLLPFVII